MTYALSSAGLWVTRANNAWGTSRQYNVGSSFESDLAAMTTDRNTWQGRANNAWGDSRVWSSGTSFEADRNYWRDTVAHGDPNVWTNRYNTGYSDGYAAGAASKTTSTQVQSAWSGHSGNNWDWTDMGCNLGTPRDGQAQISVIARLDAGGGDPHAMVRILINGGVVATGNQSNNGTGGAADVACQWAGGVAAGWTVSIQAKGWCSFSGNNATVNSGTMYLTVGST